MDLDREDGEMSDDNAMVVDVGELFKTKPVENCTVLFKADKDGIVVEQLEKVDAIKLEERAKRFGLNLTGNRVITQKQIDELYDNFGIESGNERHFRFDSVHLKGIDGLSTREIFEYLEDYKPISMEWIDDISCNVVCQDHISAALALLVHSREIRDKNLKEMLSEKLCDYHWREGVPHPKKDLILMRFATNGDKKMVRKKTEGKISDNDYDESLDSVSKNPWGDLCKSWGVYDHQEIFQRKLPKHDYEEEIEEPKATVQIKNKRLAMRLGKRSANNVIYNSDESNSDSEWKKKSKTPRMRMHADDEESKQKKKNISDIHNDQDPDTFAPLSIEVINTYTSYTPRETTILSDKFKTHTKATKSNVQSRLGKKVVTEKESFSSDESSSSDNSDHNIMSKVQKVTKKTNSGSVWSRLEKDSSDPGGRQDLRHILKSKKHNKSDDLRGKIVKSKPSTVQNRLGKLHKTNLRIEIDNN